MGEKLVAELGYESGVDTLGRWMSHHVADLMTRAKEATGEERLVAEKACAEAVLSLWAHRSALPGKRPFSSFDEVFNTLRSLSGKNPYFMQEPETSDEYLKVALSANSLSKEVIRLCVAAATLSAASKEDEWLEHGVKLGSGDEEDIGAIKVVFRLIDSKQEEPADDRQVLLQTAKNLTTSANRLSKLVRQAAARIRSEAEDK